MGKTPKHEALLVEDSLLNALVAIKYLNTVCTVDHTSGGEQAIEFARAKLYDIVLMDINLGSGMDGIEATQRIRALPGYEQVPILALTGYTKPADKERLLANGFTQYLGKPYVEEELVVLIEDVLASGHTQGGGKGSK